MNTSVTFSWLPTTDMASLLIGRLLVSIGISDASLARHIHRVIFEENWCQFLQMSIATYVSKVLDVEKRVDGFLI